MNSLGIYIHIPFCASKCDYCDFYSYKSNPGEMFKYAKALKNRISSAKGLVKNHFVDSIYFGGGTPTVLNAETLCGILSGIFAYDVKAEAEITLEANPGTVDREMLFKLRKGGFNRISFGMQSSNKAELSALGRKHEHKDTIYAVESAKAAGFENISLDIMLGIPGQTQESLQKTLEDVRLLSPRHISAYCLKIEPGTPMSLRDNFDIPNEDEVAELYEMCYEKLESMGFFHYEISNFAMPGYQCVHNMKYWKLSQYLGFGPGAHSLFNGKRFYFEKDTRAYMSYEGADALHGALSEDFDQKSEKIMLFLRTAEGITKDDLREYGDGAKDIAKLLDDFTNMGFAGKTEKGWKLSRAGFLISNTIISQILDIIQR